MKIVSKPVDMISYTPRQKEPIPHKFRYAEGDNLITIKVDNIMETRKEKMAGIAAIVYRCQSSIRGEVKVYELKYTLMTCAWELYKI